MKEKYLNILGLQHGATQDEIKKAYRKSAMKYHPDKKEGNQEKFLLIFEAYEYLTKVENQKENLQNTYEYFAKKSSETNIKRGNHNYTQQEFEEKLKRAKEKFKEKKYREYVEENEFFENLTRGWKMHYFKILTGICTVLGTLFTIDIILPSQTQNSIITFKDLKGDVATPSVDLYYVEIDDQAVFIHSKDFAKIYSKTRVSTTKTPIFNEIKMIHTTDAFGSDKNIEPHYSLVSTFPLVLILLLIPLLTLVYKRRNPLFIFLFITSSFIFPIILSILLIVNNRWSNLIP